MGISYSSACKVARRPITAARGSAPSKPDGRVDLNAFTVVCFLWPVHREVFLAGRVRYQVLKVGEVPRLKLVAS